MFGKKKANPYYDMNGGSDNYNTYEYADTPFKTKKVNFFWVMLVVSCIASCIYWAVGEIMYHAMLDNVPGFLMIGLYFMLFGMVLMAGLVAAHVMCGSMPKDLNIPFIGISMAILLLGGMLLEFLYELNMGKESVVDTECIFLIDNSGSMEDNDPDFVRIAALDEIVKEQGENFRYAVYTFGYETGLLREMENASVKSDNLMIAPNGGTPIATVLSMIQSDIEDHKLQVSKNVKIVLLTDGAATDNRWFFGYPIDKPLKYFSKKNIAINTVGLGVVDDKLMQKIADSTGGIFIMANDVKTLTGAMVEATKISADRNLISYRPVVKGNLLYAILRIIFVAVLGMGFLFLKLAWAGNTESESMIFVFTLVGSILAGLLMELLINAVGLPPALVHLICCILIGMTPAYMVKYYDPTTVYGTAKLNQ